MKNERQYVVFCGCEVDMHELAWSLNEYFGGIVTNHVMKAVGEVKEHEQRRRGAREGHPTQVNL
jgi:hypothetical protein